MWSGKSSIKNTEKQAAARQNERIIMMRNWKQIKIQRENREEFPIQTSTSSFSIFLFLVGNCLLPRRRVCDGIRNFSETLVKVENRKKNTARERRKCARGEGGMADLSGFIISSFPLSELLFCNDETTTEQRMKLEKARQVKWKFSEISSSPFFRFHFPSLSLLGGFYFTLFSLSLLSPLGRSHERWGKCVKNANFESISDEWPNLGCPEERWREKVFLFVDRVRFELVGQSICDRMKYNRNLWKKYFSFKIKQAECEEVIQCIWLVFVSQIPILLSSFIPYNVSQLSKLIESHSTPKAETSWKERQRIFSAP